MSNVIFHKNKCIGCGSCVMACIDEFDRKAGNHFCSLHVREETACKTPKIMYEVTFCHHCVHAPCAASCLRHCFSRDAATGRVILDAIRCVGCGQCQKACVFQVIRMGADGKASKCNGCIERVRAGQPPRCVSDCPVGALSWQ